MDGASIGWQYPLIKAYLSKRFEHKWNCIGTQRVGKQTAADPI